MVRLSRSESTSHMFEMAYPLPKIDLHTLHSSDGSATYTSPTNSHTLICGVNYPLELPYRSKEIPEDTYIEVNLRPHNGVGQVKERHIEQLVKRVLSSIIRGEETPRCYLQCIIQVTQVEEDESLPGGTKGEGQGGSYLEVLAGAVNVAVLGCLDAGVQMSGVAGACVVGIGRDRSVVWPGLRARKTARSLHVFAFGREGESLLCESEGEFGVEEWIEVEGVAREVVAGRKGCDDEGDDVKMEEGESVSRSLFDEVRSAVEARVVEDSRWKE